MIYIFYIAEQRQLKLSALFLASAVIACLGWVLTDRSFHSKGTFYPLQLESNLCADILSL